MTASGHEDALPPHRPNAHYLIGAALGDEAAESRIWAGIHYRSDIDAGRKLALAVAEKVIARAKQDGVPWLMRISQSCSRPHKAVGAIFLISG